MNNRQRKKWLRKNGLYINPRECWNLDYTIAKFVLPRLKQYKKDCNGYPGELEDEYAWYAILDKMIIAFEYICDEDDWWMFNPKYDYTKGIEFKEVSRENGFIITETIEEDWVPEIRDNYYKEKERRQAVIREGLDLFSKYYQDLWW